MKAKVNSMLERDNKTIRRRCIYEIYYFEPCLLFEIVEWLIVYSLYQIKIKMKFDENDKLFNFPKIL